MMLRTRYDVVLLLGAPGAGKGTQARVLATALDVPHVASGDLLREHRSRGTALGQAACAYMDRGDLVPDDLVVGIILDRLRQGDTPRGALLDGFPRTLAQAAVLDERLAEHNGAVRSAVYVEVSLRVLVERLSGRWLCRACHASYHEVFNPSAAGDRCAACGGDLYQRPDDKRDVVENRIDVYLRDTRPVIDHYGVLGALQRVDGDRGIEAVRADILAAAARPPLLYQPTLSTAAVVRG